MRVQDEGEGGWGHVLIMDLFCSARWVTENMDDGINCLLNLPFPIF